MNGGIRARLRGSFPTAHFPQRPDAIDLAPTHTASLALAERRDRRPLEDYIAEAQVAWARRYSPWLLQRVA